MNRTSKWLVARHCKKELTRKFDDLYWTAELNKHRHMRNRLLFLFNPTSGTKKAVLYAETLIKVRRALIFADSKSLRTINCEHLFARA